MKIDPRAHKAAMKERGIDIDKPSSGMERLDKPGTYEFVVVGFETYRSSQKGTPGIMFRAVIVDGPEAGKQFNWDVWLAGSMSSFLELLLVHHFEEPFDASSLTILQKRIEPIFDGTKVFRGQVKEESYEDREGNDRVKLVMGYLNKSRKQVTPEMKELVQAGYDSWAGYCKWRKDNPRDQAPAPRQETRQESRQESRSNYPNVTSTQRSNGYGQRSAKPAAPPVEQAAYDDGDDEIPF